MDSWQRVKNIPISQPSNHFPRPQKLFSTITKPKKHKTSQPSPLPSSSKVQTKTIQKLPNHHASTPINQTISSPLKHLHGSFFFKAKFFQHLKNNNWCSFLAKIPIVFEPLSQNHHFDHQKTIGNLRFRTQTPQTPPPIFCTPGHFRVGLPRCPVDLRPQRLRPPRNAPRAGRRLRFGAAGGGGQESQSVGVCGEVGVWYGIRVRVLWWFSMVF